MNIFKGGQLKQIIQYVIALAALLILGRISSFAAERVFFYHTDAAGTPVAMTDASGNVVWQADYKPFGEEHTESGSVENKNKFVGKEKDEETDLYYFGARYLDARTGRFIMPDPVGISELDLMNPQRLNRYVYGLNNPYRYVDPDGRLTVHIWNYQGKDIAWGHASLTLEDGTHISWWPSEQGRERNKFISEIYTAPANDPQTFLKDVAFEGQKPDHQIRIIGLDEKKIEKWWLEFKKTHQWKTLSQNCSTTAADALKEGGGEGHSSFPKSHNLIWTPNNVKEFANDIKKNLESR